VTCAIAPDPRPHDAIRDAQGGDAGRGGAALLFEVFSQRYERGSALVTSNLPFDEWTGVFGSERLTGALLDRLTHHVHILEMNGDSYRLKQSKQRQRRT
jgi:DNA replication protein DnaC